MQQTIEYDINDFQASNMSEADKTLLVKFFLHPREDKAKSLKEGRPIFKDVECIDIKTPGDRNGVARPATEADKKRFSEHYRRFKDRVSSDVNEGTPLSEWSLVSRSLCEELAFFHVKTVEQLANMADTQAGKFMGLYALREKAKKWIEASKKDKPLYDMSQKILEQKVEIDELKTMVSKLVRIVEGEENEEDEELNERQVERKNKRLIKTVKEKVVK